jgi:hypothetical protein
MRQGDAVPLHSMLQHTALRRAVSRRVLMQKVAKELLGMLSWPGVAARLAAAEAAVGPLSSEWHADRQSKCVDLSLFVERCSAGPNCAQEALHSMKDGLCSNCVVLRYHPQTFCCVCPVQAATLQHSTACPL